MLLRFLLATVGIVLVLGPLGLLLWERIVFWLHARSMHRLPPHYEAWRKANILPRGKRVEGIYSAPMRLCDAEKRIPDEYIVYLDRGHTLEDHQRIVGDVVDLQQVIGTTFPVTNGLFYTAKLQNAALNAVRADVGVEMLECQFESHIVEGVEPDDEPEEMSLSEWDERAAMLAKSEERIEAKKE